MKRLVALLLLVPTVAWGAVTGVDDVDPNIPPQIQKKLDDTITGYYLRPEVAKVDTVLDIMNSSALLRKKTAWLPIVGFLTVVFENNKQHIFSWMGRNDYNAYAQDVFINALLNARLPEAAYVFAQAHQWKKGELNQLRSYNKSLDLRHLQVTTPGHVDTLWGAFFASGDPIYVNEIIDVLFMTPSAELPNTLPPTMPDMVPENKQLAQSTLSQYAPNHKPVRDALAARIAIEQDEARRQLLEHILANDSGTAPGIRSDIAIASLAALIALITGTCLLRRKRK